MREPGHVTGEEDEVALTLAEAASRLNVTKQRVNQMLKSQELSGPEMGEGRAPPNVGRVWTSSVEERLRVRGRKGSPSVQPNNTGGIKERVARLEAQLADRSPWASADELQRARNRERAASQAAQILKIRLDTAISNLDETRADNVRLSAEVARLSDIVLRLETQLEQANADRTAYSDSLSVLLGPGDPSEI